VCSVCTGVQINEAGLRACRVLIRSRLSGKTRARGCAAGRYSRAASTALGFSTWARMWEGRYLSGSDYVAVSVAEVSPDVGGHCGDLGVTQER